MATASNSSSAPIQARNSHRSRQSRRSSAARSIPSTADSSPPSPSLSGIVDQEQFVTSSDSFPSSSSFAEDDSTADSQLESSDNGGAAKKPAWNKPSNGATAEVSAVMGADSWPALSESARASPKSSSTNSLKSLPPGSNSVSQEMSVGSLSSPKEANTIISTPNSSSNNVAPIRQRSMKRGGGNSNHSNTPANSSLSQALPTQGAVVETPSSHAGKSSGYIGESSRDNTKDAGQRGGSHSGNEQQSQRSSFRRNNSGPQSRGDGSYHHNHGGRRDQDRGKQDWGNPHRRESHAPQQRVGSRPFLRGPPPPPNAAFAHPLAPPVGVRPFATPMVYTEVPSHLYYVPGVLPDSFRPMHMVPIPPAYYPMPDPHLPSKIVNQIDYYFSDENLVKDTFLRQNMDNEGWVPIKLIAGFKKVMQLTDNIQLILHAIQGSNVVEIQGDKVRRRIDWPKWIMPPMTSSQSINM
ncbi:RNA-binding protein LARP/SRO9 [Handroanthus impetiginosus]|uniref:RNA-binding protein LARP/SRO9 n=1 Tax=Handroanthus impetiginosus TaxID=429701 RepID=A0A2G9GW39_9LAMI|nr:RNA-binding protein LARP/SRO9 [Handroanthus impetiginosus]